jgi:hypothetical protein
MVAALAIVFGGGCDNPVEHFEKQVKTTVDPNEVQAWATNLIAKAGTNVGDSISVRRADVPAWVESIYRKNGDLGDVTIERIGQDDPRMYVQICYGGGFGHWGLIVGPPTLILGNPNTGHNRLWKPGIYFWDSP